MWLNCNSFLVEKLGSNFKLNHKKNTSKPFLVNDAHVQSKRDAIINLVVSQFNFLLCCHTILKLNRLLPNHLFLDRSKLGLKIAIYYIGYKATKYLITSGNISGMMESCD